VRWATWYKLEGESIRKSHINSAMLWS
jgi:hypothetical protein